MGSLRVEKIFALRDPSLCCDEGNLVIDRAYLEKVMQQCPNCWEPMSITANVCPHCRYSEGVAEPPAKRQLSSLFWLSFVLILALSALLVRYLGFS